MHALGDYWDDAPLGSESVPLLEEPGEVLYDLDPRALQRWAHLLLDKLAAEREAQLAGVRR